MTPRWPTTDAPPRPGRLVHAHRHEVVFRQTSGPVLKGRQCVPVAAAGASPHPRRQDHDPRWRLPSNRQTGVVTRHATVLTIGASRHARPRRSLRPPDSVSRVRPVNVSWRRSTSERLSCRTSGEPYRVLTIAFIAFCRARRSSGFRADPIRDVSSCTRSVQDAPGCFSGAEPWSAASSATRCCVLLAGELEAVAVFGGRDAEVAVKRAAEDFGAGEA